MRKWNDDGFFIRVNSILWVPCLRMKRRRRKKNAEQYKNLLAICLSSISIRYLSLSDGSISIPSIFLASFNQFSIYFLIPFQLNHFQCENSVESSFRKSFVKWQKNLFHLDLWKWLWTIHNNFHRNQFL